MPLLSEDITQEENRRIAEVEKQYDPRIEEEQKRIEAAQKADKDRVEKYNKEQKDKYNKALEEAEQKRELKKTEKDSLPNKPLSHLSIMGFLVAALAGIWTVLFFVITRIMALLDSQSDFRFWAEDTLKSALIVAIVGIIVLFAFGNDSDNNSDNDFDKDKTTVKEPLYTHPMPVDTSYLQELEKCKNEECERKRRDVGYVAPLATDWACIEDVNQYMSTIQTAINKPEENLPRMETLPSLQTIVPSVEWIPEWAERTHTEVQQFATIKGITVPTI